MAIPPSPGANTQALLATSVTALNSDVIGLQEVDFYLERSSNENQVEKIATIVGAQHWAFTPSIIGSPDDGWQKISTTDIRIITSTDAPHKPSYGIGLISKIPVLSWHRLELSAAPFGMPMAFPVEGKLKSFYMKDHPRCAIAGVLENGWLIINTHLSFVPIFNFLQLLAVKRWVRTLPVKDKEKIILMGDLNIPVRFLVCSFGWNSLVKEKTFPSWSPRLQIDYLLSQKVASEDVLHIASRHHGISDHLPLTVDLD